MPTLPLLNEWHGTMKSRARNRILPSTPRYSVLLLPGKSCHDIKLLIQNNKVTPYTHFTLVESRKAFIPAIQRQLQKLNVSHYSIHAGPLHTLKLDRNIDFAFLDILGMADAAYVQWLIKELKPRLAPRADLLFTFNCTIRNSRLMKSVRQHLETHQLKAFTDLLDQLNTTNHWVVAYQALVMFVMEGYRYHIEPPHPYNDKTKMVLLGCRQTTSDPNAQQPFNLSHLLANTNPKTKTKVNANKTIAKTTTQIIKIEDQEYDCTVETVPLNTLTLDPENPRLVAHFYGKQLSQKQIEEALQKYEDIPDLYARIKSDGALLEPLIVSHDGTIKEGNRRFIACQQLLKDGFENFRSITVRRLPKNFPHHALLSLLLEQHTGKREWKSFATAKMIYDGYKNGVSKRTLSLRIGRKKAQSDDRVAHMIRAFEMTLSFIKNYPKHNDYATMYAIFLEAVRSSTLRDRLDLDQTFKSQLAQWFVQNRIADTRQIRILGKILNNDCSRRLWYRGTTLEECKEYVEHFPPNEPWQLLSDTTRALNEAGRHCVKQFQQSPSLQRKLDLLEAAIAGFRDDAGIHEKKLGK